MKCPHCGESAEMEYDDEGYAIAGYCDCREEECICNNLDHNPLNYDCPLNGE